MSDDPKTQRLLAAALAVVGIALILTIDPWFLGVAFLILAVAQVLAAID